jgi:hypothetical protein
LHAGDPRRLAEPLRRAEALARLLVTVLPLSSTLDPVLRQWRLGATMFSIFGALALLVAAIGLYGVIAYGVAQRLHEMGVRIALGARTGDLLRLVVGEGVRVVVVGILLGGAGAVVASKRSPRCSSVCRRTTHSPSRSSRSCSCSCASSPVSSQPGAPRAPIPTSPCEPSSMALPRGVASCSG